MIYRNFLLFLHCSLLPLPGSEKIDGAIDLNNPDFSPVFVRMSDQVVNCAGEYEKQTIDRSEKTRSKNRKEVIGLLQQKAKNSWEALSGTLRRLSKEERFEIFGNFGSSMDFPALPRPLRSGKWPANQKFP